MKRLAVATDLTLPADAVTQAIAILGVRRSGKTYCARKFAEQFAAADQQLIIVDPKGDYWGIQSTQDGNGQGLPITILGGEHGNLPLESGAGELIAKLVVEQNVSLVLDLSAFRKNEIPRFMTPFLETLYRMKAREQYRTPVMVIIDEADAIAPQKPYKGEERMLGAAEDLVRRGGQRGLGCILATQRPAVLNKNVLTQCEVLVAMRTTGSQDIDAIDDWIKKHGNPLKRKLVMESIASLPTGTGWFWSPNWPGDSGIFQKSQVLPIETFDSGATPKAGAKKAAPKKVAVVDLVALRVAMADTIERAKQDDPRELRLRIASLEKQLKAAPAASTAGMVPQSEVDRLVQEAVGRGSIQAIEQLRPVIERAMKDKLAVAEKLRELADRLEAGSSTNVVIEGAKMPRSVALLPNKAPTPPPTDVMLRQTHVALRHPDATTSTVPLGKPKAADATLGGAARVLKVLAQRYPLQVTRRQLATLAGIAASGGTFGTYFSRLKGAGYIDEMGGMLSVTPAGLAAANVVPQQPQTTEELLAMWRGNVGGAAKLLDILVDSYPAEMSREDLARAAEVSAAGGTFGTYLSRLRSNGLIEEPRRGWVKASATLFEGGGGSS